MSHLARMQTLPITFLYGNRSWIVKGQKVIGDKLQWTLLLQGQVFLVLCKVINLSILFRWISISRNSGSSNRQETSRRIQNAKTKTCGQQTVNKYMRLLNLLGWPYGFSPILESALHWKRSLWKHICFRRPFLANFLLFYYFINAYHNHCCLF